MAPIQELIEGQLEQGTGPITHVVLQPSVRDAHHLPVFPQPGFQCHVVDEVAPYVHLLPNPAVRLILLRVWRRSIPHAQLVPYVPQNLGIFNDTFCYLYLLACHAPLSLTGILYRRRARRCLLTRRADAPRPAGMASSSREPSQIRRDPGLVRSRVRPKLLG